MKPSAGMIAIFLSVLASASIAATPEAPPFHQLAGKVRCVECHTWVPLINAPTPFQEDVGSVCARCHKGNHGKTGTFSHPVNIPSSMEVPRDMPLDAKGRITCVTCHKLHSGYKDSDGKKMFFLRRSIGKAFCYSCHKKPLF